MACGPHLCHLYRVYRERTLGFGSGWRFYNRTWGVQHAGKVSVLHDTTELDFTGHKSLRDWLCQNALVVSPQTREVLGLAGTQ